MNHDLDGRLGARFGFAASLTLGALFVLYIFCFMGILLAGPLFTWKGLEAFLDYTKTYDQALKYISYAGMLLFSFAWIVLAEALGTQASGDKKICSRLGAAFASMFALASGANYFVQLVGVRLSIAAGDTGGLSQIVMANPVSAMESVNMLGWTFLLGLSSLFLSFVVEEGKGSKVSRVALRITGCVCVTAGFAFALNCTAVVALCMYPLLGGGLLASSAALAVHFRSRVKAA